MLKDIKTDVQENKFFLPAVYLTKYVYVYFLWLKQSFYQLDIIVNHRVILSEKCNNGWLKYFHDNVFIVRW